MNRNPILLQLASLLLLLVTATSCHSSKNIPQQGESTTPPGEISLNNATLPQRYTLLTNSWKDWRDMEMGLKIQLTSPAKLNAAGKAYFKRGEWISISIRMIGFEVATLWVDRDSVVAVDKFHKKYISIPTPSLLGDSGLTIENIQDLLLGRAFIAGEGMATPEMRDKFDFEKQTNGWYLLPRKQPADFNYGFLASLTENALRGAVADLKKAGTVQAYYSDNYESRNCGWFAREVTVENSKGKRIRATLKWDLNGAKFNNGTTKSCRIPDDCEKIEASALPSLLKSL